VGIPWNGIIAVLNDRLIRFITKFEEYNMFPGSTIINYLFWMAMGLLQVLVVAGAYEWLKQ